MRAGAGRERNFKRGTSGEDAIINGEIKMDELMELAVQPRIIGPTGWSEGDASWEPPSHVWETREALQAIAVPLEKALAVLPGGVDLAAQLGWDTSLDLEWAEWITHRAGCGTCRRSAVEQGRPPGALKCDICYGGADSSWGSEARPLGVAVGYEGRFVQCPNCGVWLVPTPETELWISDRLGHFLETESNG